MTTPAAPAHPCRRCSRALGTACCEVDVHEQLATLTHADLERIRQATARAAASFAEEEWFTEAEARDYEERRPLYRGYFRHATARLTLRRKDGACVFLDRSTGCTLAPDVRPTACLLYPFDLFAGGEWGVALGKFGSLEEARAHRGEACLAIEEADGLDALLRTFGTTREEIEALGQRLAAEVAGHGRRGRPLA